MTGISPDKLSKIIHEWILPNQEEKKAIAKALQCEPEEIFGNEKGT
jgi:hypothetical protein